MPETLYETSQLSFYLYRSLQVCLYIPVYVCLSGRSTIIRPVFHLSYSSARDTYTRWYIHMYATWYIWIYIQDDSPYRYAYVRIYDSGRRSRDCYECLCVEEKRRRTDISSFFPREAKRSSSLYTRVILSLTTCELLSDFWRSFLFVVIDESCSPPPPLPPPPAIRVSFLASRIADACARYLR